MMLETILYLIDLNYTFCISFFNFIHCIITFLAEVVDVIESSLITLYEIVIFFWNFLIANYSIIVNTRTDYIECIFNDKFVENILNFVMNNLNLVIFLSIIFVLGGLICCQKLEINRLNKSNKTLKQSNIAYSCVVCQDATSTILLLPCKHLCCCYECFNQMNRNSSFFIQCPLCRSVVEEHFRIFV